jgi:hypothetical protein
MKYCFATAALFIFTLNAHAEARKWVDADGTVHYSDSIPPEVTTSETVRNISRKSEAETPAAVPTKSIAEREAEYKKAKQKKEESSQRKTQEEARVDEKKRNCETARKNLRSLEEGGRIVTYDANGERAYLEDSAREQRLAEAQKSVSENCN